MNIDYSRFLYLDSKNVVRIHEPLLDLLAITTKPRLDAQITALRQKGPISLNDFVTLSQSKEAGWMRQGARANLAASKFEQDVLREAQLLLNDLKLFDRQTLPRTQYDGAVMLGSSTYLADRFFELQDLLSHPPPMQIDHVFLMGSNDTDLTATYRPKLEAIVKANPERFKDPVIIPETLTEHGVMHFFIENLRMPESFSSTKIVSLPTSHAALGRKPTTQDEINNLTTYMKERMSDRKIHLAGFSNPPFCFRQNLTLSSLESEHCSVDTASASMPLEAMDLALALDEVARLCYQLQQLTSDPVMAARNIQQLGLHAHAAPQAAAAAATTKDMKEQLQDITQGKQQDKQTTNATGRIKPG